jgi:hypothetical protein
VTGRDDDIAAALPKAPSPAPARRAAAIAEAMRRFDGGWEALSSVPGGRTSAAPAPWRSRFNRPQAGALAGALLVALVALPLAWSSLPDQAREGGGKRTQSPDPASIAAPAAGPASPSADPAPDLAEPVLANPATPPAPAGRPVSASTDEPAADPPGGRSGIAVARSPAEQRDSDLPAPAPAAADAEEIVVTGSRIRNPDLGSPLAVTSIGGEEFDRAGKADRRGDWNACTIDDPRRDLRACRSDVASVARGASGKASAPLAEGLSNAWKGDLEAAVAAFDRAIQLAPRSAAAHLNRGLARRRLGDGDRALADLNRAVTYAPQSARVYYHRSLLLRERGEARRALADERRAVELDADYAELVRAQRRRAR